MTSQLNIKHFTTPTLFYLSKQQNNMAIIFWFMTLQNWIGLKQDLRKPTCTAFRKSHPRFSWDTNVIPAVSQHDTGHGP